MFIHLKKILLTFIYFWDRERQSMNGGGSERGRHRIWNRHQALSCQHVGLELTDHEIITWAKVRHSTNWATQVPWLPLILKMFLKLQEYLKEMSTSFGIYSLKLDSREKRTLGHSSRYLFAFPLKIWRKHHTIAGISGTYHNSRISTFRIWIQCWKFTKSKNTSWEIYYSSIQFFKFG